MSMNTANDIDDTRSDLISYKPQEMAVSRDFPDREVYNPAGDILRAAIISAASGILSLHDAAKLLNCSVDSLRRVPIEQLPTYAGPGRCVLYMLDDIRSYLRNQKRIERRGSGLGINSNRPRPEPYRAVSNPADIALRNLGKGGL